MLRLPGCVGACPVGDPAAACAAAAQTIKYVQLERITCVGRPSKTCNYTVCVSKRVCIMFEIRNLKASKLEFVVLDSFLKAPLKWIFALLC